MHLSAALRLLGELTLANEGRSPEAVTAKVADLKSDTTKAMAALTERLQAVSHGQRTISIRDLPRSTRRQRSKRR
jgi:hypothetical protein